MAHSLHNLVLDVCCNNTHLFTSREKALQVTALYSYLTEDNIQARTKLYLQTRKFNYVYLGTFVLFLYTAINS